MNAASPRSLPVLAVLDDAAAGAVAIELSSTLAQALQRDLELVYVESSRALGAAALPFTQSLPHAGSSWLPLSLQDVEQGFRADAARLRSLAARIAVGHAVNWSLRVLRGNLADAAIGLGAESDLLLAAARPPLRMASVGSVRRPVHRPVVAAVTDDSEAGQRAARIAARLAQALAGVVETLRVDDAATLLAHSATLARCDVLVLPRAPMAAGMLALLRCPVLLVG